VTEETTADPTVPLRDRVEAPRDLAMPDGPEGIQWRPLSVDDAATLAELQERISRRDHPTWSESVDELQEELEHSWVDPAHDGLLAVDADGTAVAWGLVVMPPDPESLVRVILFGGVDPAHRGRGVGRRLLAWQRDRARQLLAASPLVLPAWVLGYAPDRSPEHGALLQRLGFDDGEILSERMNPDRWPEFKARFAEKFLTKTRDEWTALLEGTDVCYAPMLDFAEAPRHPHNVARGAFVEIDGVTQPAPAPRFSRTAPEIRNRPPVAGENNREALEAWGFSAAEIDALAAADAL